MFNPQFQISQKLLTNIKQVAVLTSELNNTSFPKTDLLEF